MQQLVYFIRKFKYFLFFLLLEIIALFLIFNNHSFHKSKYVNSSRAITGWFYTTSSNVSAYFNLHQENKVLVEENLVLKNQLEKIFTLTDTLQKSGVIDSVRFHQKYEFISAKIIKNEYHKSFNHLLLDKGKKDAVFKEMGVINSKGILGITDATSTNYARVQSILNKNSRINARFKNNFYFGTLIWNGKNYHRVQLIDIPRQAPVSLGDTIITGGKSTIFPEGILIGTVQKINLESTTTNSLDIELFNDMSNIGNAYIINNFEKIEIRTLENLSNE